MKLQKIQVLKVCIAFIITVAGLFMGQALWQNYAVDLPLDKALNGIPGVERVTWDNSNNINEAISINVTLGNTVNLQKTYEEISKRIKNTLKTKQYTLKIHDSRSLELEQAYYDIHYYIQKSIVDGDFPLLKSKVQEQAEAVGAAAKVYVDEYNIYLQMTKNESSLYAVTARITDVIGGNYQ